ncbi:MAG TPA: FAD binding domain-containing protein, partial [Thermomicrobiaceae bacterium]|nr:FAD binding domain-containing protein [Thermomicrobiaceae bacterium]
GDSLIIGPLTTYDALLADATLQQTLPLIGEAANVVGDLQVRNRGTIGGAAAHADPAADFPAVLLALEAQFRVVGPQGERTIAAADFFQDLFTTALQPTEVLTEIRLPVPAAGTGMAYEKFAHPASGYAVVGVAAVVGQGGQPVRVAITGAGPVATRATATEQALSGQPLSEPAIAQAAQQAGQGMTFLGDIHAGEDYRRHLTQVYTRRALTRAWQQAQG